MGSWRKVGAFLGLVPDDNRPYGDDDDLPDHYADEPGSYRGGYDDEQDYRDYPEPAYAPPRSAGRFREPATQGALALQSLPDPRRDLDFGTGARPVTVKLAGFAEARVIGERYRDGQSVILDMTDMQDADARRLVDFAAGLAFALHGSIDKVTTKVFMLLPPDADVGADGRLAYAGR